MILVPKMANPATTLIKYSPNWLRMLLDQASLVTLYSFLILSTSMFIYITLYNIYVPVVQYTRPVHLQFDSTCQKNCSHPHAVVNFNDVRSSFYLARGQSYKFVLALEMPESDINWSQGMFMIRLRLIESQGKTLYDISRPAILKYKTLLTRFINSLVYWPFLITSFRNEMQVLHVQLIDSYIEGAKFYFNKMDRALVEIIARDIQIYSANLHVLANLSGLSYYMYQWRITSAAIGVSTLASFMAILSVYRGHSSSRYQLVRVDDQATAEEDGDDEEEARLVGSSSDCNEAEGKKISGSYFTGDIDEEYVNAD